MQDFAKIRFISHCSQCLQSYMRRRSFSEVHVKNLMGLFSLLFTVILLEPVQYGKRTNLAIEEISIKKIERVTTFLKVILSHFESHNPSFSCYFPLHLSSNFFCPSCVRCFLNGSLDSFLGVIKDYKRM